MTRLQRLLSLTAAAAVCTPAVAQQTRSGDDNRSRTYQNQQSDQDRQQNSGQAGQQGAALDWESTTIVGYDLNGDGIADTYYAASRYDIERMRRQAEQQRQQMSAQDRQRMDQHRQRAMQSQQAARSDRYQQNYDRQSDSRQGYSRNDRGQSDFFQRNTRQDSMRQSRSDMRQDRMDRDRMSRMDRSRMERAQRDGRTREANMEQTRTLRGTVKGMKDFNLTGVDGARTIARIETNDGQRVAVILGKAGQVDNYGISQGDSVMLRVKQGSINNRHVLVADRLRANGQTRQIEQQKTDNLKRINGEIVATKTQTLRSRDGQSSNDQLLLKVKNNDGRVNIVSLGPVSRIDEERLQRGEEVSILASPTTVNGHHIYQAHKISHDGQTKTLATSDRRNRDMNRGDRNERDRNASRN